MANAKNSDAYLLGEINAKLDNLLDRQAIIDKKIDTGNEAIEKKILGVQLEVDEIKAEVTQIKEDRAYTKGKVVGVSGAVSAAITALGFLASKLF